MAPLSDFNLGGLAAGLAGGLLSGMFGIGGGIVLVPLLGLLLGLQQQEAQGVTLAVLLLPVGFPAVLAYRKRVAIRWWLVAALVTGFVASVALGALVANAMSDRLLRMFFAIFVVAVAAQMWRVRGARPPATPPGTEASPSSLNGLWIGAIGGFLAGLFGVGGGIVMVPLLVLVLKLEQHEAQARCDAAAGGSPGGAGLCARPGHASLVPHGDGGGRLRGRRARRGPDRRAHPHRAADEGLRPLPARRRRRARLDGAADVRATAHPSRADWLQWLEDSMSIERYVRLFAGSFVLLSLALGAPASPVFQSANWLWFTAFVGANLVQSVFTGFCPLVTILRALRLVESRPATTPES
jgi:uncharacterized membrane protein YfcA